MNHSVETLVGKVLTVRDSDPSEMTLDRAVRQVVSWRSSAITVKLLETRYLRPGHAVQIIQRSTGDVTLVRADGSTVGSTGGSGNAKEFFLTDLSTILGTLRLFRATSVNTARSVASTQLAAPVAPTPHFTYAPDCPTYYKITRCSDGLVKFSSSDLYDYVRRVVVFAEELGCWTVDAWEGAEPATSQTTTVIATAGNCESSICSLCTRAGDAGITLHTSALADYPVDACSGEAFAFGPFAPIMLATGNIGYRLRGRPAGSNPGAEFGTPALLKFANITIPLSRINKLVLSGNIRLKTLVGGDDNFGSAAIQFFTKHSFLAGCLRVYPNATNGCDGNFNFKLVWERLGGSSDFSYDAGESVVAGVGACDPGVDATGLDFDESDVNFAQWAILAGAAADEGTDVAVPFEPSITNLTLCAFEEEPP